jgi:colanic acid biosynthesis glycosyl transferase WcaI
MRYLIHDFAGHPFQVQLSRELAALGHQVTHVYPAGLPGPKGRLEKAADDPSGLEIRPIQLSGRFKKYSARLRFVAHRKYSNDLKRLIRARRPDVVLSGNTPIDVQAELLFHCRLHGVGFIHWVQDVYCQALEFVLRSKAGSLGALAARPFRFLEKAVAKGSGATVVISPSFRELLVKWGVDASRVSVRENWAPLDEVKPLPRDNSWAQALGLGNEPRLIYSGTLGLKHRPELLYELARELEGLAQVIVVSEGVGRTYLEHQPRLSNLTLLDFQPYECISEVLASADVLLATLESDAGQFAVPSKILSYLCAGRALLLAGPRENLAASVVERSGGGIVVTPNDSSELISAAKKLISQPDYRMRLGENARHYASQEFDIVKIGNWFAALMQRVSTKPLRQSAPVIANMDSLESEVLDEC